VDEAITEQLMGDIVSPEFVSKVTGATKDVADSLFEDSVEAFRQEIAKSMDLGLSSQIR